MDNAQFMQQAQQIANDVLVWIGFGTVVGLLAKAIMPGRDPGGALATLAMGIAGTVIGCGSVSFFYTAGRITPISPLGLVAATAGAFVLLLFYRVLAGYWRLDGSEGPIRPRRMFLRGPRYRDPRYVEADDHARP